MTQSDGKINPAWTERVLRWRARVSLPDWSSEDCAWLAGFVEGEGSIQVQGVTPHLKVVSTDLDVVERCAGLMGVLCRPNRAGGWSRKPQWRVVVTGQRAILAMERLLPHMGRRRERDMSDALVRSQGWEIQ